MAEARPRSHGPFPRRCASSDLSVHRCRCRCTGRHCAVGLALLVRERRILRRTDVGHVPSISSCGRRLPCTVCREAPVRGAGPGTSVCDEGGDGVCDAHRHEAHVPWHGGGRTRGLLPLRWLRWSSGPRPAARDRRRPVRTPWAERPPPLPRQCAVRRPPPKQRARRRSRSRCPPTSGRREPQVAPPSVSGSWPGSISAPRTDKGR